MKKLAVVHFMPLEYYPPVTNFLNFIAEKPELEVIVFTNRNIKKRKPYCGEQIRIERTPFPDIKESSVFRLIKYWLFNLNTLWGLIKFSPEIIYYYESYSAWPVYAYLKFFKRSTRLFIHNHEYFNSLWYRTGMLLVKWYHELEIKYLYHKAEWISQTNEYRLHLFSENYPKLDKIKLRVLRNFTPKKWLGQNRQNHKKVVESAIVRFVYIGSLSLDGTYIKEFCKWIILQDGKASFDIYSYNLSDSTKDFLNKIDSKYITFYSKGIEYNSIPEILVNYHIGVIFYKAYSDNVVNCISNKFYEYLACGLDIWFSAAMKATWALEDKYSNPQILKVDFSELSNIDFDKLKQINGVYNMDNSRYTCEREFQKLVDNF